MIRQPRSRRGVVILVVLSLLVLFVLLVVTFAILAGQYQRTAAAFARQELLRVEPEQELGRAFYQLLRDTTTRSSVARFHSLLRDFYGESGFRGTLVSGPTGNTAWHIYNLNCNPASPLAPPYPPNVSEFAEYFSKAQMFDLPVGNVISTDGQSVTLSTTPGYYNGCVLTIVSGPAKGQSTRIVGYRQIDVGGTNIPVFRVLAFKSDNGVTITPATQPATNHALVGAEFIVNGRPFTGTGFGFSSSTNELNDTVFVGPGNTVPVPIALLPNHSGRAVIGTSIPSDIWKVLNGGTNESYDAVDNDNMILAMNTPWIWSPGSDRAWGRWDFDDDNNGTKDDSTEAGSPGSDDQRGIIPSFHRPALIHYWMSQIVGSTASVAQLPNPNPTGLLSPGLPDVNSYWSKAQQQQISDIRRLACMRPIEPNFDGSNPYFTNGGAGWYVYGPWDVDNDGDGHPDSIWVDLGSPVQTAPDGRRYKPLFAVMCVDLDGRLNVNSHGRLRVYSTSTTPAITAITDPGLDTTAFAAERAGFGIGPPEINLSGVTSTLTTLLSGRYGTDGVPGGAGLDSLAQLRFFEEPANYFATLNFGNTNKSSYFNPPDMRAELKFGIDVYGQPASETLPTTVAETRSESPYELNLVQRQGSDLPYTPAELERVLRRYDFDRDQLPDRLTKQLDLSKTETPYIVTTDSFDPPVPHVASVIEALRSKLDTTVLDTDAKRNAELDKMLSPDLALGVRMDINRPFGNGRNNGTGVADLIDEMDEQGEQKSETTAAGSSFNHTNGLDMNNDGVMDEKDGVLARHLFARHLYVLTMGLVRDPVAAKDEIAQWAINVVDFRDSDSIMTPFEYDTNPFNGWSVDGIPTDRGNDGIDNDNDGQMDAADPDEVEPERNVVWGCERPELLISETLAFHDRRTEDTDKDPTQKFAAAENSAPPGPGNNGIDDWDQRLKPRGAFFVELFNPWTSSTTDGASDLHTAGSVDLTKKVAGSPPAWRLAFVPVAEMDKDPDDPDPAQRPTLERRIYFTSPPTPALGDYWSSLGVPSLPPGQYAVVGSSGIKDGIKYVSPVGRLNTIDPVTNPGVEADYTGLQLYQTRRIELDPSAASPALQVRIIDNGTLLPGIPPQPTASAVAPDINDADILPPQAIVIDLTTDGTVVVPRSLSISEPVNGYESLAGGFTQPSANCIEGEFGPALDEPLDVTQGKPELMTNQTILWGAVHLQRLANPLLPYHADTNPYRTIDSMRCDLTAFNGAAVDSGPGGGTTGFYAVQRGDRHTGRELWPQEPTTLQIMTQQKEATATHYFDYMLRSSLGYLNHSYWKNVAPYFLYSNNAFSKPAYRGAPDPTVGTNFSWLTWNNRPFASAYELMLAPPIRSSQLLKQYSLPNTPKPYEDNASRQYGHLANFFWSDPVTESSPDSMRSFSLFDYVHVPSRFVGADTVLNPSFFSTPFFSAGVPYPVANPHPINPRFLTPFNRISNFRDPGRVNINTIFHPTVWNGIKSDFPGLSFEALVTSRRGFADDYNNKILPNDRLPAPDPWLPTYFANVFRPVGYGKLVPLDHMKQEDIETTILRSNVAPPDVSPPAYKFSSTAATPTPSAAYQPLLEGGDTNASTDNRNAFFRYQMLGRMGNMVTTRSNVYAIWITVGYFEAEPNVDNSGNVAYDEFHPDGLRMAQELGLDTAQVRRHRAFFMVDRTIPVGFVPGQNHNVDKCVLLRRVIE